MIARSIFHAGKAYRRAAETDILDTWRRHGFRPTTLVERLAQQAHGTTPAPAPQPPQRRTLAAPAPLRAVGGGARK